MLVHKGLSTLDVLVLVLLITALFDALLGWPRTYTFAHATSRADAILGAQLFGHLLGLPLAYFETRPTGQTVGPRAGAGQRAPSRPPICPDLPRFA